MNEVSAGLAVSVDFGLTWKTVLNGIFDFTISNLGSLVAIRNDGQSREVL